MQSLRILIVDDELAIRQVLRSQLERLGHQVDECGEGEQAVKMQLVDNPGLDDVNPDELSGGKWICSFSHENEPTGTGEYAVEIPKAGDYHLWVRAAAPG